MSYLITCSSSKNCPESIASSLKNLSYPELNEYRIKIIELAEIKLDWNRTLPAWKLYSGNYSRLYPQVTEQNWNKPNTDVKILSALFGWIKHTDRIPHYDLQMKSKIDRSNKFVYRIWNEFDVLQNLVYETDIDLLSDDYSKAINNKASIKCNSTQCNIYR